VFGWLLTLFLGLCLYFDVRFRRLPNWLNGLIFATGLLNLLSARLTAELIGDRLLALTIVSLFGALLFYRGWLGGGDIKLAIALSVWLGCDKLVSFFVILSLTGGLLAIAVLGYNVIANYLNLKVITTLPYGLAIVAGATVLLT